MIYIPKVSVLVPVYGVERYIERCARSLFEQTYHNIEYVFVDDCTKDQSIDILHNVMKDYPHRRDQIRIIHHECNRGLAAARNTGVDASTGEYLMHVDSDDFLDLRTVETLIDKVRGTKMDIVFFGTRNVMRNGQEAIHTTPRIENKIAYVRSVLLHSEPASIWNKFYRAEFYKASGVRSIEGINYGEDYVVVPRLIHEANYIEKVDIPLYHYELGNTSSYTNSISVRNVKELKQAVQILKVFFSSVNDKDEYADAVQLIDVRSMLALIKKSKKENFVIIRNEFAHCFAIKYRGLSKTDKLLLVLLRHRVYNILSFFLTIYKYLL